MSQLDVLCIGNAIVDIIARCEDDFLTENEITKGARFGSGRVAELLMSEDPAGDLHKLDTFYMLWASHATELGYSRTDHSAAIRLELTRKRACLAQPSGRSSDDAYHFHRHFHLATSAHPLN